MVPSAVKQPHSIREGFSRKVDRVSEKRQEKSSASGGERQGAIPSAEEAGRAWNSSLVPASITRPHGTGRVLDAESGREGVESVETSSGIGELLWGSFSELDGRYRSLEALPDASVSHTTTWHTGRVSAAK